MWITTTITIFRLKPNQHTMRSTHSTRESRTLHTQRRSRLRHTCPQFILQVIWNFITDPTIGPHSRVKRKFHQDKLKKKSN